MKSSSTSARIGGGVPTCAVGMSWLALVSACGGLSQTEPPVAAAGHVADAAMNLRPTWNWQLQGIANTSYDAQYYDLDLFDTPQPVIDALHARGITVVCYFSAGSYEAYRPDADAFARSDLGRPLDGYPDERWLDIRSPRVTALMVRRLDMAVEKRCDAVEPDNVDGFENDPGFPLTAGDQLKFNLMLARAAHARGLQIGLKNDLSQIGQLHQAFDFAVNEQCHEYDECDALRPFLAAGKPVFHTEYAPVYRTVGGRAALCDTSRRLGLSTIILSEALDDSYRDACP